MDDHNVLAERFEENRTHLKAVAYRMPGSASEADDAVQETWLRLSRFGTSGVENLRGWLTTIVARVCLDMLRSRRSRREDSPGAPLTYPIVSREDGTDPEHQALLTDSVGLALLVVLETLAPAERVAFVLHDVFAVPFDEIAPIVGRSPSAARQLASRARHRVQGVERESLAGSPRDAARKASTPSLRHRAVVTSPHCSRCLTPMLCSAPTLSPCSQAHRVRFVGQGKWPRRLQDVPRPHSWRSSTVPRGSCGLRVGSRGRCSLSRSVMGRSSKSRFSPTPSD